MGQVFCNFVKVKFKVKVRDAFVAFWAKVLNEEILEGYSRGSPSDEVTGDLVFQMKMAVIHVSKGDHVFNSVIVAQVQARHTQTIRHVQTLYDR